MLTDAKLVRHHDHAAGDHVKLILHDQVLHLLHLPQPSLPHQEDQQVLVLVQGLHHGPSEL